MMPFRPQAACTRLAAAAIALALAAPATPVAAAGHPAQTHFDRFIVRFKDGAAEQSNAALRQRLLDGAGHRQGLRVGHLRRMSLGADVIRTDRLLDADAADAFLDRLLADPRVLYAEIDRRMYRAFTPNDTRYAEQWHYSDPVAGINAPAAWDVTSGGGQVVAVLDTGITAHTDLAGNLVAGYDFVTDLFTANDGDGRDNDPSDPGDWITTNECDGLHPAENSSWHGTHVAGTIAAVTNNAKGVAGVAFGAKVQPLRVLGKCGGYNSDIADAIVWASGGTVTGVPANATPARVINLSLGGGGPCSTTYQNAINAAVGNGATVVVAAGNSNDVASRYQPASCDNVITVGAVDRSGARAGYSNFGAVVDLSAPGGGDGQPVLSTLNAGTTVPGAESYAGYNGTSMATPHVAGVAALVQARAGGNLTPAQVESLLKATTRALPVACPPGCGVGLLDAAAAVAGAGTAKLSVSGPSSMVEGDSGTRTVTFNVDLTVPAAGPVTFDITTENGTATAGSDFVARTLTGQTLPAGQTRVPFEVTVNSDADVESDETFSVRISNSSAPVLKTLATTTILGDDAVTLANGVPLTGISGGIDSMKYFQIDLPAGVTGLLVRIAGGSGDADLYVRPYAKPSPDDAWCYSWGDGNDHACPITSPVAAARYYILIHGWTAYSGVTLTATYATVPQPSLSVDDASVVEGNSGTRQMTFTATLSATYPLPVSFLASAQNGTAIAGPDFAPLGYLEQIIPAGQLSKAVSVDIRGDTQVEPNETLHLNLSFARFATLADSQGIGTIVNDDVAPNLSINDPSITEGNSGTKQLAFTVSLAQAAASTVTFVAATQSGTAAVGSDFVGFGRTGFSIPAGQTSRLVNVTINGDTTFEPNENLKVNLSTVAGATLVDGQGLGTILNDDTSIPGLRINDVAIAEGNAGTKLLTFTATLTAASANAVTFNANTQGVTAASGVDFVGFGGPQPFSIPAGQTTTNVPVTINGDTTLESNETFNVNLSSAVGATVLDGQGVGTIANDDVPGLRINDASISEGNAGTKVLTFTVSLSSASASNVTFNANTQGVTAAAGVDFVAFGGPQGFNIPAGQLSTTVNVTINGDTVVEDNETFNVNLSSVTGTTLLDGQGIGTITNDDVPGLRINDASISEGNAGAKVLTFTVSLTSALASNVTFNANTQGVTAAAGVDFVAFGGPQGFNIPAGQLSTTVNVTINGDTTAEANETFNVNLSSVTGTTLLDGQGVGTITNDD